MRARHRGWLLLTQYSRCCIVFFGVGHVLNDKDYNATAALDDFYEDKNAVGLANQFVEDLSNAFDLDATVLDKVVNAGNATEGHETAHDAVKSAA